MAEENDVKMTVKRVLVLYTGGTIGMQRGQTGLVPAGGFDTRLRQEQASRSADVPEWTFEALEPPLDSANMTQQNWLLMRDAIVTAYDKGECDGALVLHGTDTLAYSAGALSFLLLGLPIPVVLTGSMLPAGVPNSDAWPNLFGAMAALGKGAKAGVHVFFNGRLMHGARVTKLQSDERDAFHVLPRKRLATHDAPGQASLDYTRRPQPGAIAILPLFPGLNAIQAEALLATNPAGLLLECYGSGTGPSDDQALMNVLADAHRRGVVLAAISQCPYGHIAFDTYEAGSRLRDTGLVSGGGMTREAALGKLFFLTGLGLDQPSAEHAFASDLCGELLER